MNNDDLRNILKPQLRTVDIVDPYVIWPAIVDHNGVPYKIVSWSGNVAHCQEFTAQEFVELMELVQQAQGAQPANARSKQNDH